MFEKIADDRIQITERASFRSADHQAASTVPTHDRADFADSAIAEYDLARLLKFERLHGNNQSFGDAIARERRRVIPAFLIISEAPKTISVTINTAPVTI